MVLNGRALENGVSNLLVKTWSRPALPGLGTRIKVRIRSVIFYTQAFAGIVLSVLGRQNSNLSTSKFRFVALVESSFALLWSRLALVNFI